MKKPSLLEGNLTLHNVLYATSSIRWLGEAVKTVSHRCFPLGPSPGKPTFRWGLGKCYNSC